MSNPASPPLDVGLPATLRDLGPRVVLRLALPSVAFVVLTNAYRSVDQYWIQGVGTAAQAAIGSSVFVLIGLFAFFQLTAAGTGPLVARATGADNPEGRRRVLGASVAGTMVIGLAVSVVGSMGAGSVAELIGLSGEPAAECTLYLRALCLTVLPLAFTPVVDQSFVAMGDTRTPMWLQGLSLGLNIVLTPVLIFDSWGPLPGAGLGIIGAALASNASRGVTTGLGLYRLAQVTGLRLVDVRLGPELWRVMRVGLPASVGVAMYAGVYWAMLRTSISQLGPHVNAALGIGFSALEGFTWPSFYGVSLAVGSLVGQALGAKRPDSAWRAIRIAFPLSSALGLFATGAFYFGARALTGLFTDDPLVHDAATTYALILAASQLTVSWEALFEGVLGGAGDTRTVFWTSVPLNICRIPLAWALALPLGMGAAGVWWAINVTTWAKALLKGLMVARGTWAELEI